jgi:glycopeptide antibiotics resistance protein
MAIGFNKHYALLAVLLFGVELAIALWVHDTLIRPFIGDVLVVILLFCLLRAVIQVNNQRLIMAVLIFSYAVEIGQYFQLAQFLGLAQYPIAHIVIGSTFDAMDLLAYTLGAVLLYVIHRFNSMGFGYISPSR